MKTNTGLAESVKSRIGQGYIYGAFFDRIITLSYIMEKAAQYPTQYTANYIERSKKWIGKNAGDCIGEIKAYIWTDESTGKVIYPSDLTIRNRQDKSAEGMYEIATEKGLIATMPDMVGILVHMQDHVGVYIGNGEVIEARGVDYGVIKTNLKERAWTRWSKCPFVDYTQKGDSMKKGDINENVKAWQVYLNSNGAALDADGDWGNLTEAATVKFFSENQIAYAGYVDIGTLLALLDMDAKTKAVLNVTISQQKIANAELAQNLTNQAVIIKTKEDDIIYLNNIIGERDKTITSLLAKDLTSADHIEKLTKENAVVTDKLSKSLEENARLESDNLKLEADKDFLLGETGRYQNLLRNVDIEIIGSRSESAQRIGNGILDNQFGKV